MPTIIIQPQDRHQPSVGVNEDLIWRLRCSICVCSCWCWDEWRCPPVAEGSRMWGEWAKSLLVCLYSLLCHSASVLCYIHTYIHTYTHTYQPIECLYVENVLNWKVSWDFLLLAMSSCWDELNTQSHMMLYGCDGLLSDVCPNFFEWK